MTIKPGTRNDLTLPSYFCVFQATANTLHPYFSLQMVRMLNSEKKKFAAFQSTSMFYFQDKDDVETALLSANTAVLQQLALKHELFKSYLGLPYLLRYVNRHRSVMMSHQSNEMKPLMLPITGNDAVVVKNG